MAQLFSSVEDLIAVLERRKRLLFVSSWVAPSANGQRRLSFRGPLGEKSAALQGISLQIACDAEGFSLPTSVVLLAEINRKPRAIARIDINGTRHQNKLKICGDWQHLDAGHTHFHDTRLHRDIPIDEMFSDKYPDLPVARPISDMPEDFSKAMEKCGELLHIENLGEIEEPQWQPRQFPF